MELEWLQLHIGLGRRLSPYGGRADTAGAPPIPRQEGHYSHMEEAYSSIGHILDEAGQYRSAPI